MNDPSELRFPQGARTGGGRRALVVVNEKVSGAQLRGSLLAHLGGSVTEVFVVAPALADSALKHTMGDVDDAIGPARERLEATLEELRGADFEARGGAGDADPIQATTEQTVTCDTAQAL